MENCPNCNQIITENFCSNCGQKKYKRIDKRYIWEEVQYIVLHTNKGFLYSIKNIIKNPGKTAREFINGNRVNHYKPLLLVFILSGISAIISFKILGINDIAKEYSSSFANTDLNSINNTMSFIVSNYALIMLASLPVFALLSRIAFKQWGHNYYEHIMMNSFVLSFYILVNILILSPLMYLFRDNFTMIALISSLGSPFTNPFILV